MVSLMQAKKPTVKRVRDVGPKMRKLDAAEVAKALGGEPTGLKTLGSLAPISLMNVRVALFDRLQSNGGRPSLSGTTRRVKIPISDIEWAKLEAMAAEMSSEGFSPSPGQVAGVLLSNAIQSVTSDGPHGASS